MRVEFPPAQSAIFRASLENRFVVAVCGRRFGKTYLDLTRLLSGPAEVPGLYWYVAPTRVDAKEIAWDLLKDMVPEHWLAAKPNESELALRLYIPGVGKSRIALKGAERKASLRGRGLAGCVLDEFADMDPDVWVKLVRPALADRMGWALITGTPQGYDHLHERWEKAHTLKGWKAFQFTTLEGGMVPAEEVAAAREDLDPRSFRQEYEASFEAIAGRIYYAFDRDKNVKPVELTDDPADEVLAGIDFNVDPMTAVIAQRCRAGSPRAIGDGVLDELHVTDVIELENSNTEEMGKTILRRFAMDGRRRIRAYPDPTGRARHTNAPIGETDLTILRDLGLAVHVPPDVYAVVDRHNTVNSLILSMSGRRRLFVNPRCLPLIKTLAGHTYEQGTRKEDETMGLDHAGAALGYLCCGEFPLTGHVSYARVQLHGKATAVPGRRVKR